MLFRLGHSSLKGLAHMAFCQGWRGGLLVLISLGLLSPFAALGAGIGAVAGAWWSGRSKDWLPWEAEDGIGAYNPALLGAFWAGPLSLGQHLLPAVMALAVCLIIDGPIRRFFQARSLQPLALTALLCAWGSAWTFQSFGVNFWQQAGALPFGTMGTALALALFAFALALNSLAALALTLSVLAVVSAGCLAVTGDWPSWSLLMAVTPAAYALPGVFLRGSRLGLRVAPLAAAISLGIWFVWTALPGMSFLPPLLFPAACGTWAVMALLRRRYGALLFDAQVQAAAAQMRGRKALALTGAGVSEASGIPDYISGAWLDPAVPLSEYGYGRFLQSVAARSHYWQACQRFKDIVSQAEPNAGHQALAILESQGLLLGIVTQNVDGLHQGAGAKAVVSLHGDIHSLRCVKCDWRGEWRADVDPESPCPQCGGLVKPAVIAMDEDLSPVAWLKATEAVGRAEVLLVIGTRLAITTAHDLVSRARGQGALVIHVNRDQQHCGAQPGELVLPYPAEQVLPALVALLR